MSALGQPVSSARVDRSSGNGSNPLDTTKLNAARLVAADLQPFLSTALYSLRVIPAPGLGTFAVDERWRLYVDPTTLLRWSTQHVAGVLLHEVGHVIRDHAARARAAFVQDGEGHRWNVAADAEINDDLVHEGVQLPPVPVLPKRLGLASGKAAEFYFHQLVSRDVLPPDPGCGPGATGREADETELHRRFGVRSAHAEAGQGRVGEDHDDGIDAVTADLIRAQVADAILVHHRARGDAPGSWVRWAEALRNPVIDWRQQLRRVVRTQLSAPGRVNYSYRRLSRRRVPGVVLPGMVQPVPSVALILDTSASVDGELVSAAWSEVTGCLRSGGVDRSRVTVWAADAAVHRVPMRQWAKPVHLHGGGGTDMALAIETAVKATPKPDVVVVFTDGETGWPTRRLHADVVVALVREPQFEVQAIPERYSVVRVFEPPVRT